MQRGENSFQQGRVFTAGLGEGIGSKFQSDARYQDERSEKEVKEGRQDIFAPFVRGPAGTLPSQAHIPCLLVDTLLLPK